MMVKNHVDTEVISAAITAILAGIGLIFAKDGNVTGVGKEAQTKKEVEGNNHIK